MPPSHASTSDARVLHHGHGAVMGHTAWVCPPPPASSRASGLAFPKLPLGLHPGAQTWPRAEAYSSTISWEVVTVDTES